MITLLVDANLDGHAELLERRLRSEEWKELSEHLEIHFLHFEDVDLDRAAKDNVVWRLCQQHRYYLLTANRNKHSDDSLETTIRNEGTTEDLPALTIGDANRLLQSTEYLERVVGRLLEYLLDEAAICGAGRLFLS